MGWDIVFSPTIIVTIDSITPTPGGKADANGYLPCTVGYNSTLSTEHNPPQPLKKGTGTLPSPNPTWWLGSSTPTNLLITELKGPNVTIKYTLKSGLSYTFPTTTGSAMGSNFASNPAVGFVPSPPDTWQVGNTADTVTIVDADATDGPWNIQWIFQSGGNSYISQDPTIYNRPGG